MLERQLDSVSGRRLFKSKCYSDRTTVFAVTRRTTEEFMSVSVSFVFPPSALEDKKSDLAPGRERCPQ